MPMVAMEKVAKQIREIEATIGGFDSQVKFLTGGCKMLSETSTAETIDSVESNLQTLVKSIEQLTIVVHAKSPMDPQSASTSNPTDQEFR